MTCIDKYCALVPISIVIIVIITIESLPILTIVSYL